MGGVWAVWCGELLNQEKGSRFVVRSRKFGQAESGGERTGREADLPNFYQGLKEVDLSLASSPFPFPSPVEEGTIVSPIELAPLISLK